MMYEYYLFVVKQSSFYRFSYIHYIRVNGPTYMKEIKAGIDRAAPRAKKAAGQTSTVCLYTII
jgi:hypothetical protein